jgi:hypothetical protein
LFCLLFRLFCVGRELSVTDIEPQSPQHTRAFLRFCFVLTSFLWICFAIEFVGIRRRGRTTWQEVVGAKWKSWQEAIRDQGIALGALLTIAVIENLSNAVLDLSSTMPPLFTRWLHRIPSRQLPFWFKLSQPVLSKNFSSAVTFSDSARFSVEARFPPPLCKY